ncbi:MarR family winged helix-turn-helix transcriptional regulator [Mycobacterium sp. Marseille-P9652]|uniref:MarR family winged helix-turn-helix transcriptional regulator n=1 Tax=Mycobacterium sp. Marseille-P9652 TaxID=2654950 RepID=UPI0018D0B75D|nr:MarR family transcriptional regulator [Mycobacterium sp. Marseille-P9652]
MSLPPPDGAAWGGLLRTHKAMMTVMGRELEDRHGLALTSYDVLRHLALADGKRLRMHELAERVMITRSGLSGVVDRLEADGLVQREPVSIDGRGWFAGITPQGWKVLRRANETVTAIIRRDFLDPLSEEDLDALRRIWRKLGTAHDGREGTRSHARVSAENR